MANRWWLISNKTMEEIRDLCLGEPYKCPNRLKMILNLIETGVNKTNAVPGEDYSVKADFVSEVAPEEIPEEVLVVPEEGPDEAPATDEEEGAF